MTWADLMLRALDVEGEAFEDQGAHRILDAAVAEVAAHGARGVTVEGVARRAGVNRTTVYRRFGDRDALLAAMVLREGRRLAQGIAGAMAEAGSVEAELVEGFVAAVRLIESHPIIRRLARHEPQSLVAAALADDAALLRLGATFLADAFRGFQTRGHALHLDPDAAGDTLARIFAAFVLLPARVSVDVGTEPAARAYAQQTLVPMFLGSASQADLDGLA